MTKSLLTAALTLALASRALAGGYQVSLQGQKQIGMGHTGTALPWDASVLFFNPGGLAQLKKSNVIGGLSFINSKVGFLGSTGNTVYTDNPVSTPFAAYAAYKVKNFAFGIGVYTPFGSTVNWGGSSDFVGYYQLQKLQLRAISIQPTVSYALTEKLSIGAGFVYTIGGVDLTRGVANVYDTTNGYGQVNLKGDASGIGYNVGINFKASEKFSIGASYRSQIDMKVKDGDATYTGSSLPIQTTTFPVGGATTFDATLPLPGTASLGIAFMPTEQLTLAADINMTFWSTYKSLDFNFAKTFGGNTSTSSPRKYKDSFVYRLGANYDVNKSLALRAGAYYDVSPVDRGYMTLETPDADRIGLTLGLGVKPTENLHLDASFLIILGQKRTQTVDDVTSASTQEDVLPGTYQQRAFIPGISIGYDF